jgi:hypothetical protein
MGDEKVWLTAREAADELGYKNAANVNRLARGHKVRTKPGARKTWFLYHRGDLLKAHDKVDFKAIRKDYNPEPFVHFNKFQQLPVPQIVISDCHCPFVDLQFLEQMLRVKDSSKIGNIVLAGDTLDCCSFSKFYNIVTVDWATEKSVARELLKKLLREFDNVTVLTANHEIRYIKKLDVSYSPAVAELDDGKRLDVWEDGLTSHILENDKLKISTYPYAYIGDTWQVSHPQEYRKIPLSWGRDQFAITMRSQITTHAHMSGWCPAPAGLPWELIDMGLFANPSLFIYKGMRITNHFRWSESFCTIDHDEWGQLYLKDKADPMPG